jgi:hypothetical protein
MYKRLKIKNLSYNLAVRALRRQMHQGYLNLTAGIRDQADELI